MESDGSNPRNLINAWGYDDQPTWTADGSRIVFHSYRDLNDEIYVMNADGSDPRNLTKSASRDQSPSFFDPGVLTVSPQGRTAMTWGWIKEGGSEFE